MRDEHRPKQELVHEITGLRKQVLDLKEAMTARRRVEDALRSAEALGTLLTANLPFARMLGYESPAELQALSPVCGVFASPEDQSQALKPSPGTNAARQALFRRKDGCRRLHRVLAGQRSAEHEVTIAVFEPPDHTSPTFPPPPA
jgi:hypothetical protein